MKNIYSNIFSFNKKTLNKSVVNLKKGNVVGLPTETVYGLAGNAYLKKSINKIYKLKKSKKSGGPMSNKETPNSGLIIIIAGIIPINVLSKAVLVRAVIISLNFSGATNKLVKFLLQISSRNNMLKLMLDRNKKS